MSRREEFFKRENRHFRADPPVKILRA